MPFASMKQLEENNDSEAMTEAIAEMDELNAWVFEAKVKEILGKLNIHHLNNM